MSSRTPNNLSGDLDDLIIRVEALERYLASIGIGFGTSPAFTWSGGNRTLVTVTHGLGRTPLRVIVSSARFGDTMGDGRAPWAVTAGNYTSTTFQLAFATHENSAIGVFSVPAGACDWIAAG